MPKLPGPWLACSLQCLPNMTKLKLHESRLINIAREARAAAALEFGERVDELESLLPQLLARGATARFEELARALAMEVAGERHDSGEITAYLESGRDPMDLGWDSWDSEDAGVLTAVYEALSKSVQSSLVPLDELLDDLVEIYIAVFDAHRRVLARGRPA